LIPELQGRFPIRVELEPLGKDDFVRILTEPKNALVKQYIALMETEGITLRFLDEAIDRIADFRDARERAHRKHRRAAPAHRDGALLDEISFEGPDLRDKIITIDAAYVDRMLAAIVKNEDLSAISCDSPNRIVVSAATDVPSLPLVLCGACSAACGRKGPPLAPIVYLPRAVTEFAAKRVENEVVVQFTVPTLNTDGSGPADLRRVGGVRAHRSVAGHPPIFRSTARSSPRSRLPIPKNPRTRRSQPRTRRKPTRLMRQMPSHRRNGRGAGSSDQASQVGLKMTEQGWLISVREPLTDKERETGPMPPVRARRPPLPTRRWWRSSKRRAQRISTSRRHGFIRPLVSAEAEDGAAPMRAPCAFHSSSR
jgi:hypothetical protein